MKDLKKVYFLYFVHEFEDGHEDTVLLGVFSSKIKAKIALSNLVNKFMEKKLTIFESRVGRISWEEGFVTLE